MISPVTMQYLTPHQANLYPYRNDTMPTKTAAKTPAKKTTTKKLTVVKGAVESAAKANGDTTTNVAGLKLPRENAEQLGEALAQSEARAGKSPTLGRFDPKGVRYPNAAELQKFNDAAMEIALRDIMLGLVKIHGTPNPTPVEGKRFVVDAACRKQYESAKAGLVQDMVSKAGLSLHRAPMLFIEPIEEQNMSKTEAAATPDTTTTTKASKAKHETVTTPHGEFRKGSVLHAIYRAFELKNGATKAEILERLVKEFPERTAEDMASTVNTQINRMPKEREFTLGRSDQGRYGLHIEGVSKARILSPEAAAKQATKQAEKAARDVLKAEEKAKAAAEKAAADLAEAQEAAKKSGITVNVPGATVVGKAAAPEKAKGKKK